MSDVAKQETAEAVETGWLIELKGSAPSWATVNPNDPDDHWTDDSTKAIRFARAIDAQACIDWIGWTEAFPSEHIWDDGRPALTAAPAPAVGEGWLYFNEDTGTEWSEQHPVESGECPNATDVRPGTAPNLLAEMRSAWTMLSEREDEISRLRDKLSEAMPSKPPAPAVGKTVAVKPLEWQFVDEDQTVRSVGAPIYYRLAHHHDSGWANSSPSGGIGEYGSLDKAKAAAQADFERRIRSVLDVSDRDTELREQVSRLERERDEALDTLENCALEYQEGYAEAELVAKQQIAPLRSALQAAQHWLSEEAASSRPGETRPDDILRVIEKALSGPAYAGENSAAARGVVDERQRQVEAEGWTPDHDDRHVNGELAVAAACYATAPQMVQIEREWVAPNMPKQWPWDWSWWKPGFRRRNLVRAGALIIAEIERLDRAKARMKP